MTGSHSIAARPAQDETSREFFHHSSGQRIKTYVVITEAIRRQYPQLKLTVAPQLPYCNLLAYASSGNASYTKVEDETDPVFAPLSLRQYLPPPTRLGNGLGVLAEIVEFGKYLYKWQDKDFILYVVNGRDGSAYYPQEVVNYILSKDERTSDELVMAAGHWGAFLHNEVWVFDRGFWQKSAELYQSIQSAEWENVILDEDMKEAVRNDMEHFYDTRETYAKLKVPWKRGIIFYGPPGNGKTISLKAIMHNLYRRHPEVPTLYVRTLASFGGPEYSMSQIWSKARQTAPCFLVFEDLDSIVSDQVRSYFLNEVDGLQSNDGILMVGSTNHLERLDPGISKRPSRFDRKYFFPDPSFEQRVAYAKYWQAKLSDNKDIEFPDKLCRAIAKITDKFSFAYIQEAFVAALLAIAVGEHKGKDQATPQYDFAATLLEDDDLDEYRLWREVKKQVKILREELGMKQMGKTLYELAMDS